MSKTPGCACIFDYITEEQKQDSCQDYIKGDEIVIASKLLLDNTIAVVKLYASDRETRHVYELRCYKAVCNFSLSAS